MKQNASTRKLNSCAQEVISNILLFDISDPRLKFVTITGCEVSLDRSACNVFYSCDSHRYEEVAAGFLTARGRIRSLMASSLHWRVVPDLRFIYDTTADEAQRISRILQDDILRNREDEDTSVDVALQVSVEEDNAEG